MAAAARGAAATGRRRRSRRSEERIRSARCDADAAAIPADARVTEPYWHRAGEAGRYTFDDDAPFGLPFRPTPFYVQVTLAFPGDADEEVIHGLAGAVPLRGQHLQRREADRICSSCRRSRCACRRRSRSSRRRRTAPTVRPRPAHRRGAATTGATPRARRRAAARRDRSARDPRDRGERHAGRGRERREARSAAGLDVDAGRADGEVHARRTNRRRCGSRSGRPPNAAAGEFRVQARAVDCRASARRSIAAIQVIEYPHIRRQHIYRRRRTRR